DSIMRRNHAARQSDRFERSACAENQQNAGSDAGLVFACSGIGDGKGAEPIVRCHAAETEKSFVEARRSFHVFSVNTGFENARHFRRRTGTCDRGFRLHLQKPSSTRRSRVRREGAGSRRLSVRRSIYFARMSTSRLTALPGTRSRKLVLA